MHLCSFFGSCPIKTSKQFLTFPSKALCGTLQHTATHCNILQHTAPHHNTLRLTANILQHIFLFTSGRAHQWTSATYSNILNNCDTLQRSIAVNSTLHVAREHALIAKSWMKGRERKGWFMMSDSSIAHISRKSSYNTISAIAIFCSLLQFVAVCCSVLQCVAVCCSQLQCNTLQHTTMDMS